MKLRIEITLNESDLKKYSTMMKEEYPGLHYFEHEDVKYYNRLKQFVKGKLKDVVHNELKETNKDSSEIIKQPPISLPEALETEHHKEILAIINNRSKRMKYRRDDLKALFHKLNLNVEFTMADIAKIFGFLPSSESKLDE